MGPMNGNTQGVGKARTVVDLWRGVVPPLVLVGFNLIPLAGVLWLGWDLFSILILYWLESGVIGVVNIFKMARAAGSVAGVQLATGGAMQVSAMSRGCLMGFFTIHYGLFWAVHGVFVFLLPIIAGVASAARTGGRPDIAGSSLTLEGIAVALVALTAYHLLEYWYGYVGKREYERVSSMAQMFAPYPRVLVLHITILAGAFLVFSSGQPVALVVLLVALKTIIDLGLYTASRRWAGTRTAIS